MRRSRGVFRVAVLSLAVLSTGCGKKLLECKSLVKTINPSMEKLNALSSKKGDPSSAENMKQMASVLDSTAALLAKLDLSTPELRKYSQDYQAMCKDTAGSFQQMLALIASMQAGARKMDTFRKGTEANMKLFEQLCSHGKTPAECKPIAKKLKQFPDDPNKAADLDTFIAEIGKIQTKNANMTALMADLAKNLTDSSKQVKEMQDGEKKAAATTEALQKVTARESAIIDGLNAFCGGK
jgi:hypothetical protein